MLIFSAEPVDAVDLVEVPAREEVELVDEEGAAHPVAFIQSVSLFEEEDQRARGLIRFPHVFGDSKVVDKGPKDRAMRTKTTCLSRSRSR